jgi:hypothetical protein
MKYLVALLALFSGLAYGQKDFVRTAKAEIVEQLTDPESARWRGLFISSYEGGQALCGEVNAKNSMGGYSGFTQFYVSASRDHHLDIDIGNRYTLFEYYHGTYCGNKLRDVK